MNDFLKNEIVVNWVAPIITGLIVLIIPAIIIKIFKNKKDEKIVKQVNQRFIDSIMPFIIQKIEIPSDSISNIRKVIIDESNIKEKYIYTELELRNKLIIDISESRYVDENRKTELIDFVYKIFFSFKNESKKSFLENNETKNIFSKTFLSSMFSPVILLIISQIIIAFVTVFDKRDIKPEDNILLILPLILGLISIFWILLMIYSKLFESKILNHNLYKDYIERRNLIATLTKDYKKIKEKNKNYK